MDERQLVCYTCLLFQRHNSGLYSFNLLAWGKRVLRFCVLTFFPF